MVDTYCEMNTLLNPTVIVAALNPNFVITATITVVALLLSTISLAVFLVESRFDKKMHAEKPSGFKEKILSPKLNMLRASIAGYVLVSLLALLTINTPMYTNMIQAEVISVPESQSGKKATSPSESLEVKVSTDEQDEKAVELSRSNLPSTLTPGEQITLECAEEMSTPIRDSLPEEMKAPPKCEVAK